MSDPRRAARLPATNAHVAAVFDGIADLLEMQEHNVFRIRAYRTAARELRMLSRDVGQMLARDEDLTKLRGIGKDLARKIEEVVRSGRSADLDALHEQFPASLHAILQLPGLGPKRVKVLFDHLGISTLAELSDAAKAERIRALPGFGETTERNILDAIAGAMGHGRRIGLAQARAEARRLAAFLRSARGVDRVVVAGSYRRGLATVGDLDLLVTASPSNDASARLVNDERVTRVLAHGEARTTVVMDSGLRVDLRVLRPQSYGAALHYFTGSKAHNIAVRKLALERGLKLNEYGVFRGTKRIAGETEASIFGMVDLPYIPAELRENRGEIEAAREGRLPDLVGVEDLRSDVVRLPAHASAVVGATRARGIAERRGLDGIVLLHELDPLHPRPWAALRERVRRIEALPPRGPEALVQGVVFELGAAAALPSDAAAWLPLVVGTLRISRRMVRPSASALEALERLRPDGLRVELTDLPPSEDPPADLGRVLEHGIGEAGFLLLEGASSQLVAAEPLVRGLPPTVPVVLASGDIEDDGASIELVVMQARRAWLERHRVLNTRPWPPVLLETKGLGRESTRRADSFRPSG